MLQSIHYKNWSRLGSPKQGAENVLLHKKNILLSQFSILGIISSVFHAFSDLFEGLPIGVAIDLAFLLILFLVYYLNENRNHKAAKFLFFFFLNLAVFVSSNIVPKGIGAYLIYFPLMAFSFVLYDYKERKWSFIFSAFTIVLLLVSEYRDYQIFGSINIQDGNTQPSFIINLLTSLLVLVFAMKFLTDINYKTEENLMVSKEKLKTLAGEVNDQNLVLEKANKELDRFVYSTSHDLRAPLKSVLGLINIAKTEQPSPTQQSYLDMMQERVNNLDDFIQEIIDYSRNTRVEINTEAVDITALVDKIIDNYKYLEGADKITFLQEISVVDVVELDKTRVSSVLNNLVSNAIKYHNYRQDRPEIRIKIDLYAGVLVISVKDNGHGIAAEDGEKIFDMFYRGTEASTGSGLGLYITKEMVEKMGGSIMLNQTTEKGSEFLVKIPVGE